MRLWLLALIAALFLPGISVAQQFERNIMTGGPKGTYIQIGRDIAGLGQACGIGLNVVESAGSLENFAGVRNRKNTQFGIVQSDVLEYLKIFEAKDAEIQQAIRGVRIMFPLYNEEIHLLARKEITSVRDLAGKKVGVGVADSGTFLTASLILDILRINDADRQTVSTDESLKALQEGKLDAFFYVAGYPASLFANAEIDSEKFHLVPLTDGALKATYVPASIPANTYPFQPQAVDTIAVKAVLMTFDYNPKRNAYHREACKSVSDFAALILGNLEQLRQSGHPKWKSVDLAELPPGWQVGACVKAGMAVDYKTSCAAPASKAKQGDDEYLQLLKRRLNPGK